MTELDFLNLRIIHVHYVEEERDKPPTTSEKSRQKTLSFYSSQMKTLMKFLPLLIGGFLRNLLSSYKYLRNSFLLILQILHE